MGGALGKRPLGEHDLVRHTQRGDSSHAQGHSQAHPPPGRHSASARQAPSGSGERIMDRQVRQEFLQAVNTGLSDVPYVVIGGSALAAHGSRRGTTDVDVLVGGGCSRGSAESLLVRHCQGRVRQSGLGKIEYVASDGHGYALDLTTDTELRLPFDTQRDTILKDGARIGNILFLLDTKAHGWQTRIPYEQNYHEKRDRDARDILFYLQALQGRRDVDRSRLRWVYTRSFWGPFLAENPHMAAYFRRAGLWTDDLNPGPASDSSGRRSIQSISSWGNSGSLSRRRLQPPQDVKSITGQASQTFGGTTLQIMSDLHLETPKFRPMYPEFSIRPRSKYLALLGDVGIASDERLFDFLSRQLQQFEVVFYVLGNHEPYGATYQDAADKMVAFESRIASQRAAGRATGLGEFVLLNRRRYDLSPQVTILGCTLFSRVSRDQRRAVSTFVSDFSNINGWTVARHNTSHRGDLAWLDKQVKNLSRAEPHRKVVVLTHHGPTVAAEANNPEHLEDPRGVQSAFVTDLRGRACWSSSSVKVWAFGHTHWNCDFVDAKTDKRVVANQRGYGREDIFNFDEDKVICV